MRFLLGFVTGITLVFISGLFGDKFYLSLLNKTKYGNQQTPTLDIYWCYNCEDFTFTANERCKDCGE